MGLGESLFTGGGQAEDQGIQRGFFATKLNEILNEDSVFKGGLGEMVEVKMSGTENGILKEWIAMILDKELGQRLSRFRTR